MDIFLLRDIFWLKYKYFIKKKKKVSMNYKKTVKTSKIESKCNQNQFSISISRWTYSDNKHDRPASRGNVPVE